MKQLNGQDAVYLYAETPSTPGHLGLLYIYDQSTAPGKQVRFKSILGHILGKTAYFPRLSLQADAHAFRY